MALSNFAHLIMDVERNVSTDEILQSEKGVIVELYKNWIYLKDEKAWNKDSRYIKPTIMEINSGNICYKDVVINSVRGEGDSIFAIVEFNCRNFILIGTWSYTSYEIKKKDKYGFPITKCIWKNVSKKDIANCKRWIKTLKGEVSDKIIHFSFKNVKPYNQGDAFFIGKKKAMKRNKKKSMLGEMLD